MHIINLVDLEQPNNTSPNIFFHKNDVRYFGNLKEGLKELLNYFKGDNEKLNFIIETIENHPTIQSYDPGSVEGKNYKKDLINSLNRVRPREPQPEDEI
jgi:hypothetical protein